MHWCIMLWTAMQHDVINKNLWMLLHCKRLSSSNFIRINPSSVHRSSGNWMTRSDLSRTPCFDCRFHTESRKIAVHDLEGLGGKSTNLHDLQPWNNEKKEWRQWRWLIKTINLCCSQVAVLLSAAGKQKKTLQRVLRSALHDTSARLVAVEPKNK